jgi:hypothetical protein|tara:strand:- start:3209 stop:3988 length:780 start_codon:yes stop_codon:yes gene_type:complete
MKPELSIILPAIRQENWDNLYDSIVMSTSRNFELIICGPYPLTEKLQKLQNVKYVKDFGSPTRASAIASTVAEGKLITWLTDDAILTPNSLGLAIDELYAMGENYKNVITCKYLEGAGHPVHSQNWYYLINGKDGSRPPTYSPHVPNSWWIFNIAIMYRSFFEELGGLDCSYEHAAMADTDLAIRAQYSGANVKMTDITMYHCEHGQADHKPVEIAQSDCDVPLIQSKYRDPMWRDKVDINIKLNNWKKFDTIWKRRFE